MVDSNLKNRPLQYISIMFGDAQECVNLQSVSYDSLLKNLGPWGQCCFCGNTDNVATHIKTYLKPILQRGTSRKHNSSWAWSCEEVTGGWETTTFYWQSAKHIPWYLSISNPDDHPDVWVCGDINIETKPTSKHLGVMIDSKMNYAKQTQHNLDKAARGVVSLCRLMANGHWPTLQQALTAHVFCQFCMDCMELRFGVMPSASIAIGNQLW